MTRTLAKLLPLLLILSGWALAQEMETRVFELKARPAESTVEMIEPLLSPGGKVVPETRLNKLVVRDTPGVMIQIERLLEQIDQPAPQVRVTVTMDGIVENRGSNLAVGMSGNGRRVQAGGTAVVTSSSSHLQSTQDVVIMSGERGLIHFAQDLVNADPYTQFAVGVGLLPPGFAVRTVATGFAVEPVVVGDVVRIRVTPWMSFQGPGGPTQVLVHEATSSFSVPSGQTVQVSAGDYRDDFQGRAFGLIFGSARRTGQGQASVKLRPEIMDY